MWVLMRPHCIISGPKILAQPQYSLYWGQDIGVGRNLKIDVLLRNYKVTLGSNCACWRPLMRPSKRPINHLWISFSIKVFQWPLKEAKRGQKQKWPQESNFEILLWISYIRITESQKLSKNSSWKRLEVLWKFNTYTRVGSLYFRLILVNNLSWGQIEVRPKIVCLKLSKRVWSMT